MKREAPNAAEINDNGYNGQARDIAVLAIAVFLAALYLVREFYTPNENIPISFAPSTEQTVFEVEEPSSNSKIYTYPDNANIPLLMGTDLERIELLGGQILNLSPVPKVAIKNGSKILINKDGTVDIGLMSGEKHLIFSIPLDINKATKQDFEALPGIGPKMAEQIIETRERLGGFKTINDIKKVKGLGEKKLDKLKTLITCKDAV